jgi:hypothetical protein
MKGLSIILFLFVFTLLQEARGNSEEDFADGKNGMNVEIIPAEESLLQPQVSEEIEERLAMIGIGKNTAGTRKRRGRSRFRKVCTAILEFWISLNYFIKK